MDVGTTLREARERQDLTIAQLAATTKIPATLLTALEENDFERVPHGIFVRGYLRAYAREVGLDPEEVIEQFLAQTGEILPAAAAIAVESPVLAEEIDDVQIDPELSGSGPGWGYVLIVAALLVAVISFNRDSSSDVPAPATNVAAAEADAPAAVPSAGDGLQPVATAGQGLRFEMRAEATCWVEAVVDGRRLVYRLMQPGERETIDVTGEVVLRIGDPAALTYSVNGRPGEPLGKAGTPVTVRFTSEGRREVLAS